MTKLYDKRSDTYDHAGINALCRKMLKWQMAQHLEGRGKKKIFEDYRCVISGKRRGSTGGISYSSRRKLHYFRNSVNLGQFDDGTDNIFFREYANVRTQPDIYGFHAEHPDQIIIATAAHEVAHVTHYMLQYCTNLYRYTYSKMPRLKSKIFTPETFDMGSHAETWQQLYRELRIKYVNNKLKNCERIDVTPWRRPKSQRELDNDALNFKHIKDPLDREDARLTAIAVAYIEDGKKVPAWVNNKMDKVFEKREARGDII